MSIWNTGVPYTEATRTTMEKWKADENNVYFFIDDFVFGPYKDNEVLHFKFHKVEKPNEVYTIMTQARAFHEKFKWFEAHPEEFEKAKLEPTRFKCIITKNNQKFWGLE